MNPDELKARYTIPQPDPPTSLYLLGLALIAGLIALFIAALHAFSQVMPPLQAAFNAALIEIGAVVEALALVRGRNKIAAAALILSLTVSGTYNYIQVQTAGHIAGISDPWQLLTLALGPLFALTFLALTTGLELAKHEHAVEAWQEKRQAWLDDETRRLERKETRQQTRKLTGNSPGNLPPSTPATNPETSPQNTPLFSDWRLVPTDLYPYIAAMPTRQLAETYRLEPRTARNWKANAIKAISNGHHHEE